MSRAPKIPHGNRLLTLTEAGKRLHAPAGRHLDALLAKYPRLRAGLRPRTTARGQQPYIMESAVDEHIYEEMVAETVPS